MDFSASLRLSDLAFPATLFSHSCALSLTRLFLTHHQHLPKDAVFSHSGTTPHARKRRKERAGVCCPRATFNERKNEKSEVEEWAKPGSDVAPPWAQEKAGQQQQQPFQPPFFVYLISSVLVAIAAVGSVFEFFNKRAVFGVIQPDNPFYTPLLGFFALTGLPTSAFLWYKSIVLANKLAEDQDKEDGFLDS